MTTVNGSQITDRRVGAHTAAQPITINGSGLNGNQAAGSPNGVVPQFALATAETNSSAVMSKVTTAPMTEEVEELLGEHFHHCSGAIPQQLILYENVLADIGQYQWFSSEKEALARTAFKGVLAAARKNRAEFLTYPLTALIDLYHSDRALHASYLIGHKTPVQRAAIPQTPPGYQTQPEMFNTHINPLTNWATGTPFSVVPSVVKLLEQEVPDTMVIVTWTQRTPVHRVSDPIIYATYGAWYVQVAQWL